MQKPIVMYTNSIKAFTCNPWPFALVPVMKYLYNSTNGDTLSGIVGILIRPCVVKKLAFYVKSFVKIINTVSLEKFFLFFQDTSDIRMESKINTIEIHETFSHVLRLHWNQTNVCQIKLFCNLIYFSINSFFNLISYFCVSYSISSSKVNHIFYSFCRWLMKKIFPRV